MCLIGDIIPQFHAEARAEEPAVRNGSGRVPDLDDVEVTLRGQGDTRDRIVLILQELVSQTVDHAVDEYGVRLGGIHLLAPGTALVILRRVPQRTVAIAHKEEHTRVPCFGRNGFHHRPEFSGCVEGENLDVGLKRVVCVVRVVVPQHPRVRERCGVGHLVLGDRLDWVRLTAIRFGDQNGFGSLQ